MVKYAFVFNVLLLWAFGVSPISLWASDKTAAVPKWSVGLLYPGGAVKYAHNNYAWEFKAQYGSGVLAAGPRYYRYINNTSLRLFWGLETDFISFKAEQSSGSGYAVGGFAGGEIPLAENISLAMDFGPMYINLAETSYSQSASGVQYILNLGIYWRFR